MEFNDIIKDLKNKIYKPIYFLMGEEPYFIDVITTYIADNVLSDSEKEFNQVVLYGKDTNIPDIINTSRRFPMMASCQVVIVKEAQTLDNIEDLSYYVEMPLQSTILVVNYKYKSLDKRKKLFKILSENAVLFESKRLRDDKIPAWIASSLGEKKFSIDLKASILLTEFLGNDLGKIANELQKLIITLTGQTRTITAEHIERNIGISKDYNNFELTRALTQKNVLKANRIINYFDRNQKNVPISMTMASLYYFFSRVLTYHFIENKSRNNVASILKIEPFHISEYEMAARNYTPEKLASIISLLRDYDLKSKGFGNTSMPPGELLKELVYKILH